jgi:hypothetical protein
MAVLGSGVLSRSGHGGVSGQCQWCGEAGELQREPAWVAMAGAQLRGDVRYLVQVQDPDDGVAGRRPWPGARG